MKKRIPATRTIRNRVRPSDRGNILLFCGLCLLLPVFIDKADAQTFDWAAKIGGSGSDVAGSTGVDERGATYVAGSFQQDCNFGISTLSQTSNGMSDIYIARYDHSGTLTWVRTIGGAKEDRALSVAVIPGGGCYVTGYITDTVILGNDTVLAGFSGNVFVAKYSNAGDLLWFKQAGGEYDDHGQGVSLHPDGGCVVTGYFRQQAVFDTFTLMHSGVFSGGESDMFLARYDEDGNVLWVKGAGGMYAYCKGYAVSTDASGNSYLTGSFSESCQFDSVSLSATPGITGMGGEDDIFIAKYNASGNVRWVKSAGGGGDPAFIYSPDIGYDIAADPQGNSYVTGTVFGRVRFDTISLTASGNSDIFIARYNSDGDLKWVKLFGGKGKDGGMSVALGNNGVFISGSFTDTIHGLRGIFANGSIDGFAAGLDTGGGVRWALSIGGSRADHCSGIALDNTGNIRITGFYESDSVKAGPFILNKSGVTDAFVAQLNIPDSMTSIQRLTVDKKKMEIYPNPFYDYITISYPTVSECRILLYDASGRLVHHSGTIVNMPIRIDRQLPPGNYYYSVITDNRTFSGKLNKK